MQLEIHIDAACAEPKIVVTAPKMTEELKALLHRLCEETPQMLAAFKEGEVHLLEPQEIVRAYTVQGRVFVQARGEAYALRMRLYELMDRLCGGRFVRISNAEIINLKKVKNIDLSLTGTICITFEDGTTAYASRRYVPKIKQALGL